MRWVQTEASARNSRRWPAAAVVAFTLALTGCATARPQGFSPFRAAVIPTMGLIYTHFYAPLVLPGMADLGDVEPPQRGPAVYVRIPIPNMPWPLALDFAFGRLDIERAARQAGIERLVYADYEFRSILGYFTTMTIHAHGFGPAEAGPPGDAEPPADP